ncbi:hypothetical protein GCM10027579_29380 [Calidifontibacter terrae]
MLPEHWTQVGVPDRGVARDGARRQVLAAGEAASGGSPEMRDDSLMEQQPHQAAAVSIEPSQYGFAVVWLLEGAEPAVMLHRQNELDARAEGNRIVAFLVRVHGWEESGTAGSTTRLRRVLPPDA